MVQRRDLVGEQVLYDFFLEIREFLFGLVNTGYFDVMFDYSRLYNSAGSNACRPELIHPILMSIIFEQYKQLTKCNCQN